MLVGSSGSTQSVCQDTFSVSLAGKPPGCQIAVTPAVGTTATRFDLSFSEAGATRADLFVDGALLCTQINRSRACGTTASSPAARSVPAPTRPWSSPPTAAAPAGRASRSPSCVEAAWRQEVAAPLRRARRPGPPGAALPASAQDRQAGRARKPRSRREARRSESAKGDFVEEARKRQGLFITLIRRTRRERPPRAAGRYRCGARRRCCWPPSGAAA